MPDVLLIQNTKSEGSGYLGSLLKNDGFEILSVNAKHEKIPSGKFSLVVILGAPESANDDLSYLADEQTLIRDSVGMGIPVLGICLGSQLIAKAFGGRVCSGRKKEIGFYGDLRASGDSVLFSGFSSPFTVFHWHGDTFDLPNGAKILASSKHYKNQAFQFKSAIGLQFHLEMNETMANLWLDNAGDSVKKVSGIDPNVIRSELDDKIPLVKSNMEIFYKNFKNLFDL